VNVDIEKHTIARMSVTSWSKNNATLTAWTIQSMWGLGMLKREKKHTALFWTFRSLRKATRWRQACFQEGGGSNSILLKSSVSVPRSQNNAFYSGEPESRIVRIADIWISINEKVSNSPEGKSRRGIHMKGAWVQVQGGYLLHPGEDDWCYVTCAQNTKYTAMGICFWKSCATPPLYPQMQPIELLWA
jgi:hypothetical protein